MLRKHLALAIVLATLIINTALAKQVSPQGEKPKAGVPASLRSEHTALYAALEKAIESGGETGQQAKVVNELLHPHFLKEELYALPPLAALPQLAVGKTPQNTEEITMMTAIFRTSLPELLQENRSLASALKQLGEAARRENKPEVVTLSEDVMRHIKTKEDILYPTTLMIGEFLKQRTP